MRRALPLLVVLLALVTTAAPALALYGPETQDPAHPVFQVRFEEDLGAGTLNYDTLFFDSRHGWDFEDRDGYECANAAVYDGPDPEDDLLLLIDFEQNKDYLQSETGNTFRINDRYGAEPGDGGNPNIPRDCGNEVPGPPGDSRWTPSGEDHFPHYNMMMAEMNGDPVTIYRDGVVDATLTADLTANLVNEDCDRAYWTPGDEPGELVLWWDVDFPEHAMEGVDLNCGGGGGEPIAVARMNVAQLASNMGVCISDMDAPGGRVCQGNVPANLSLSAVVVNDDGGTATAGDFTLSPQGAMAPGTYTITATGPAGYTATFGCANPITLGPGESASCVVTLDDPEPAGPFFARPDADAVTGSFTPTPLFSRLDDNDNADFVSSPSSTSAASFTVDLSDIPAGTGTLRLSLKKSAANSVTVTVTSEGTSCQFSPTTSFATYTCPNVSTDGVASVQVSKAAGPKLGISVGWLELEVP